MKDSAPDPQNHYMSGVSPEERLLVVDDNEVNRDLLQRTLERADYEVDTVRGGRQALEAVGEGDYDLVLLDIMMPEIDGLEVLKRLREHYELTELPVVMVTAKQGADVVADAFELGANDYVTKPLQRPEVQARVETHLQVRDASHAEEGRGDFHKLTGLDAPTSPDAEEQVYCPACASVVHPELLECRHCESERPESGWPTVESSEYAYLGETVADRFYLRRWIGRGHIGEVYEGTDLDLSRPYAVKIVDLRGAHGGDVDFQELRERTRREAEVLARLSTPHVVKIHEVQEIKDGVFGLVMDYVDGQTLEEWVEEENGLEPLEVVSIARQMAQGLYDAHEQQIIHCDIQPSNFMIEPLPVRGHFVYILDFGISQFVQTTRAEETTGPGNPHYCAPEQIATGRRIEAQTDVYGLGAVLYYSLVGEPPYAGLPEEEVVDAQLHESPPTISTDARTGNGYQLLQQLIDSMMAKEPEERIRDMAEVISCLDAVQPVVEREHS